MEDVNFEYKKHSNVPVKTEELLSDLKRAVKERGKVSQSIYVKEGRYDCSTIIRRFGAWNKALKEAGINLSNEINISDERLYENLLNLWQRLGCQPRRSDLTVGLRPALLAQGYLHADRVGLVQQKTPQ